MIDYEDDETCLPLGGERKFHRYSYDTQYSVEYRKKRRKNSK